MPQNTFFLRTHDLLVSQKMTQRHFFSTLHPLSTVIFATATVLAFVLLRNSRFNFHCYAQRKATPTQKSAQKCAATSRDFLCERLQSAFTLANQLRWIAQYRYSQKPANRNKHHAIPCAQTHMDTATDPETKMLTSIRPCSSHSMLYWTGWQMGTFINPYHYQYKWSCAFNHLHIPLSVQMDLRL